MTVLLKVNQTPAVALYSPLSAAGTSVVITPYPVDLDGNKLTMSDFGNLGYCTVDPKIASYEEILSFTGITDNGDGTATLTGLSRDLTSKYPYTTTGVGKTHGASAILVFSNNPQIYGRLAGKDNDETITGFWTFPTVDAARPGIGSDVDTAVATAFITFGQLSRQAIAGAANASTTVKGIVELATQAEIDARTTTGGSGAKLVPTPDTTRSTLLSDYVVDTGTANAYVITPAPAISGYIAGQGVSFKATNANTGASTVNTNALGTKNIFNKGAALIGGEILANQIIQIEYDGTQFQLVSAPANTVIPSQIKFGGTGADGALVITSGTTTLSLGNAAYFEKNYTSISITGTGVLAFSNPGTNGTVIVLRSQGAVTLASSATPMIDASGMGASATTAAFSLTSNINAGADGGAGTGGSGTAGAAAAAGNALSINVVGANAMVRTPRLAVGSGGGAGGTGGNGGGAGGAGGRGGGALYIECAGAYNFTTASGISVAGKNGSNGVGNGGNGGGGGGGGAGGTFIALYNTLTANSGTITVSGGTGGNGGASGVPVAGGTGGGGGNGTSGTGTSGAGGHGKGDAGSSGSGAGGSGGAYDLATTNGSAGGDGTAGVTGAGAGGGGGASGYSASFKNNMIT